MNETLESGIAALAGIGESKIPKNEYKTPAAINGQKRVSHKKNKLLSNSNLQILIGGI
jgi:hypothetical protein